MKRNYLWPLVMICVAVVISIVMAGESRLWGENSDFTSLATEPSSSFYFHLELEGQDMGEFDECSGLGSSNRIEEAATNDGGAQVIQKTPGALEWHGITLKRTVLTDFDSVAVWRRQLESGNLNQVYRGGTITMYWSGSSAPLVEWTLQRGWPASLVFNGTQEELVIVHQGLQRDFGSSTGGGSTR